MTITDEYIYTVVDELADLRTEGTTEQIVRQRDGRVAVQYQVPPRGAFIVVMSGNHYRDMLEIERGFMSIDPGREPIID